MRLRDVPMAVRYNLRTNKLHAVALDTTLCGKPSGQLALLAVPVSSAMTRAEFEAHPRHCAGCLTCWQLGG